MWLVATQQMIGNDPIKLGAVPGHDGEVHRGRIGFGPVAQDANGGVRLCERGVQRLGLRGQYACGRVQGQVRRFVVVDVQDPNPAGDEHTGDLLADGPCTDKPQAQPSQGVAVR